MDQDKLKALAAELAKDIKSEKDLGTLTQQLIKLTVETVLNAEMDEHLGYEKHVPQGRGTGNNRNGDSTNDADISATLVSNVTERVIEQVHEWQSRPLDPLYPIVYLDCIVLKIRENQRVINKSLYLAQGLNMEGHKELLGLWLAKTEGAKFWLSVLTELKNRGLEDILIACADGLKGFPDAIAVEYPQTKVQLCIVHMVRNSLRYVFWKDYKAVTADLKPLWDSQYPQIARSWQSHWVNLITLFDYPPASRKVIYTTNAIESLNSVPRKATKQRKLFPTDESALKVAFLAIQQASKKWTMPIQNWKPALNRFMIEFGDRLNCHL